MRYFSAFVTMFWFPTKQQRVRKSGTFGICLRLNRENLPWYRLWGHFLDSQISFSRKYVTPHTALLFFFVWKMFIYSNSNTSHLHNYYAILRCISWSECIIWSDFYGISIEFRIRALWLDQNFVLGAMMPEWWETASDPETSLPRHDAAT